MFHLVFATTVRACPIGTETAPMKACGLGPGAVCPRERGALRHTELGHGDNRLTMATLGLELVASPNTRTDR